MKTSASAAPRFPDDADELHAVEDCHAAVHAMGCVRSFTAL